MGPKIQSRRNAILWFVASLVTIVSVAAEHEKVWPHPQNVHETESYLSLSPDSFQVVSTLKCDLLDKAIARFTKQMFIQDCSLLDSEFKGKHFNEFDQVDSSLVKGKLTNLTIKVQGKCEEYPYMKMDESYQISIDSKTGATISGATVWGALRGLETFSQLLDNVGLNQFVVKSSQIDDYPRFSHRGLMIDSARHFLPLKTIYRMLDAMEMNKLNVLHWHIVDDQSFPFVSETFPELTEKGAYNPKTHIYTVDDVKTVIEYARQRGIRVVTEFDSPGHTNAWGKGIKDLLTPCYHNNAKNGNFGPMDPTKNATYTFVEKLFSEIVQRFPDHYVHLGGDEVDFGCWASNPEIKKFMEQMKYGNDYGKLEAHYIQRLVEIVQKLNHSYIVWQEVFDTKVKIQKDTVVHVWKGGWQKELESVVKAGYQALISSPWYLDYISYGSDWARYYQQEPISFNATKQEEELVLGGEACLWAEFMDASNVISRAWPRASATAERLWSSKALISANQARPRFLRQHCRMQKLGVRAEPNAGPGYCQCDYAM